MISNLTLQLLQSTRGLVQGIDVALEEDFDLSV